MLPQSKGKIFLSDERGLTELESFRSCNTFNFGNYCHPHKGPFGALYVLNEDTLAGGSNLSLRVEAHSEITLLPIVGTITYHDSLGNTGAISAGGSVVLDAPAGLILTIENPYREELVKFVQWWVRVPAKATPADPAVFSFDLTRTGHQLVSVGSAAIGRLAAREEAVYKAADSHNGLFAFVIQGEMEVQYRLLHTGDGLALWQLPEMEMEALSGEAIILVIEVPASY